MASITDKIAQIRQAIFGKDVRENIASGIEAINTEVEDTTTKQNNLGSQFNSLVINSGSSNAEIVAGRTSNTTGKTFDTMGHRIDDVDGQLNEKANKFVDKLALTKILNHTPVSGTINILQGFCIFDNFLIFALKDNQPDNSTTVTIIKYNLLTNEIALSANFSNLKHANDITYVSSSNLLYLATDGTTSVARLNADTLAYIDTVTFPVGVGAIDFDSIVNQFAVRCYSDEKFYILDFNLNVISSFSNPMNMTEQGLCFNDGKIYMAYYESGSTSGGQKIANPLAIYTNAITAFDTKGTIIKTWYTGRLGENEGVAIYNNRLILGFNDPYGNIKYFYSANYKSEILDIYDLTSLDVEKNTDLGYVDQSITVYCDSTNAKIGDGTLTNPFQKIKDAISYIYNVRTKSDFTLNLSGDFQAEGTIIISGLSKKLFITGNNAKVYALYLMSCNEVRVDGLQILNVNGSGMALYIDGSKVDIRNCIITNTNNIANAKGIYVYNGTLYLSAGIANTITGFSIGLYAYQSEVYYHQTQNYVSCTAKTDFESCIAKAKNSTKVDIVGASNSIITETNIVTGSLSMQCTTANTPVSQVITVNGASSILFAAANALTGSPQSCDITVSATSGNTFTITFVRTDTTATGITWMAAVQ